jgi:hypothetical protein
MSPQPSVQRKLCHRIVSNELQVEKISYARLVRLAPGSLERR